MVLIVSIASAYQVDMSIKDLSELGVYPKRQLTLAASEGAMKNGEGICITLDDDVFGDKCDIYIHLEDIIPFCELEPILGNCIVAYIWKLYKEMSAASTLNEFRFVNPFSISYVPKSSMNVRTQVLADRLLCVCPNQLVIVSCNVGISHHWILTIIDPTKRLYTCSTLLVIRTVMKVGKILWTWQ